jgi:hypothetical protein
LISQREYLISQRKDMISQRNYTTQTIRGRTADCECESCMLDVSKVRYPRGVALTLFDIPEGILDIPEEGYDIPEGIHDTNNSRKNN